MALLAIVLSFLLCFQISVSQQISEEEFSRFPPFRHLDRFSRCVQAAGGAYCVANADLVADGPNELYDAMKNYSYSMLRHLDYTKVRYGYCITQRCKEFYTGSSDEALMAAMGACLNHTLEREYGLRARVAYGTCYSHHEQKYPVTGLDRAAAALYATIALLVVAGTLYDLFAPNKDPKGYLMCFSLPANWAKLRAPWPKDNDSSRLIGINGIRTMTSMVVTVVHASIPLPNSLENPLALEKKMELFDFKMLTNLHLGVQTFVFMSGLFLAYTSEVASEKAPVTWRSLPKNMFFRWMRIAPVYLLVILYCTTWFKFVPYGPYWEELVEDEFRDCKQNWLSMVLFYNNYVYGNHCNPHHWSTAVDMHLYLMGLMVLALRGARGIALAVLLALGVLLPGLETYARDLDGVVVASGKRMHNIRVFNNYDSFNYLHQRTHTNIPAFFVGMAFGLFLYQWMKKNDGPTKDKRYAWGCWASFPMILGLIYSHTVLVSVEGRPALALRVLFAMFPKMIWALALCLLVLGIVSRAENLYRPVLEWPGWVPLMRLGFCLYNGHMIVIRWVYAVDSQLTYLSDIHLAVKTIGIISLAYMLGLVLFLCVEAPSNNLIRKLFPEKKSVLDVKNVTEKKE